MARNYQEEYKARKAKAGFEGTSYSRQRREQGKQAATQAHPTSKPYTLGEYLGAREAQRGAGRPLFQTSVPQPWQQAPFYGVGSPGQPGAYEGGAFHGITSYGTPPGLPPPRLRRSGAYGRGNAPTYPGGGPPTPPVEAAKRIGGLPAGQPQEGEGMLRKLGGQFKGEKAQRNKQAINNLFDLAQDMSAIRHGGFGDAMRYYLGEPELTSRFRTPTAAQHQKYPRARDNHPGYVVPDVPEGEA